MFLKKDKCMIEILAIQNIGLNPAARWDSFLQINQIS